MRGVQGCLARGGKTASTYAKRIEMLAGVQTLVWQAQDKSWTPSQNLLSYKRQVMVLSDRYESVGVQG